MNDGSLTCPVCPRYQKGGMCLPLDEQSNGQGIGGGKTFQGTCWQMFCMGVNDVGPNSAISGRFSSKVKENSNSNMEFPSGR